MLAVHQGLWCCLCWRDPGVIFDRVRAELLARNELSGAGNGAGWLAGNGLVSKQRVGQPYLAGRGVRARERAQAARLLHRRHLLLAGRLALRHVVHLHMVVDTGRLLGYQRGCCWAIGGVHAAREGRKGLRATACACAPAWQGRACC